MRRVCACAGARSEARIGERRSRHVPDGRARVACAHAPSGADVHVRTPAGARSGVFPINSLLGLKLFFFSPQYVDVVPMRLAKLCLLKAYGF
jgi:hypothetical protein